MSELIRWSTSLLRHGHRLFSQFETSTRMSLASGVGRERRVRSAPCRHLVKCDTLETRYRRKGPVGSNPAPPALYLRLPGARRRWSAGAGEPKWLRVGPVIQPAA